MHRLGFPPAPVAFVAAWPELLEHPDAKGRRLFGVCTFGDTGSSAVLKLKLVIAKERYELGI